MPATSHGEAQQRQRQKDERDGGQRDTGRVARVDRGLQQVPLAAHRVGHLHGDRGRVPDHERDDPHHDGTRDDDPESDDDARRATKLGDLRVGLPAGEGAAQDRADPAEQVGDPDEVGHDEVPVQATERQQLLQRLDVDEHDGEKHRRRTGLGVEGGQPGDRERVEVDAAEVGADPAGTAQAVRLGDVGEEGGVDDIDGGTDLARRGSAVVAGGGVAELVDDRGGQQDAEHGEQQRRIDEDRVDGSGEAGLAEQPDVGDDEAEQAEDDDGAVEERGEQPGEEADRRRGDQGAAEPQRQQRVRARQDALRGRRRWWR